jgi:hypothetical protein
MGDNTGGSGSKSKSPSPPYKGPDWRKGGNPLKKPDWAGHGSWRYGGGTWNHDKFKDKK